MKDPFVYEPKVFSDDRGTFSPSFLSQEFPWFNIVQENTVVTNNLYTFRGLHFQKPPFDQAKFLRCVYGRIIDFAVDIRSGSPTFGKTYYFDLSGCSNWVFIPRGFAHGYITLENYSQKGPTLVEYKVDNYYSKENEGGIILTQDCNKIIFDNIPLTADLIINDRDLSWPTIDELETPFKY